MRPYVVCEPLCKVQDAEDAAVVSDLLLRGRLPASALTRIVRRLSCHCNAQPFVDLPLAFVTDDHDPANLAGARHVRSAIGLQV